jgi:hypothetical protein
VGAFENVTECCKLFGNGLRVGVWVERANRRAGLGRKLPVSFDKRFHWFHGDTDISMQILYRTEHKVTYTDEGLVVHNHRVDATRQSIESDPKAVADERRFKLKWRYTKLVDERVVDLSYSERALKLAKLVIRDQRECSSGGKGANWH